MHRVVPNDDTYHVVLIGAPFGPIVSLHTHECALVKVRLAKVCRSLYLFEQADLLESVQEYARGVQLQEKRGAAFRYGAVVLDELLHFRLPRRAGAKDAVEGGTHPVAPAPASPLASSGPDVEVGCAVRARLPELDAPLARSTGSSGQNTELRTVSTTGASFSAGAAGLPDGLARRKLVQASEV